MIQGSIYWACGAVFVGAGIATGIFTPIVARLSLHFGVIDKPNARKVHTRVIPRLGGIAVFAGIMASLSLVFLFSLAARALILQNLKPCLSLAGGATLLLLTGAVDDIRGLTPRVKLIFQTFAGLLAFYGGFHFILFRSSNLLASTSFETHTSMLGWVLSLGLTIFWMIGTTNAVNLIDGLDGLASGITAIAFSLLGIISIGNNHLATAMLAFVSAGAACGFLFHNRHPAKIFLGDSGSLLLGYLLATLSIDGTQQGSLVASLVGPLCLLYIPILDTILAMVRRTQNGLPFSFADKFHIHHRLLQKGIRHPDVVLILWGVTLAIGGVALLLHFVKDSNRALIINLFAVFLMALTVWYLGSIEWKHYLHSLRNINRRKLTPRDKVVTLRRLLINLPKNISTEKLFQKLSEIVEKMELDSALLYLENDSLTEKKTVLYSWARHNYLKLDNEEWQPQPPQLEKVSATFLDDEKHEFPIVLEIGKQSWKFRRKSEDIHLWAKLLIEKLVSLPALQDLSNIENVSNFTLQEQK